MVRAKTITSRIVGIAIVAAGIAVIVPDWRDHAVTPAAAQQVRPLRHPTIVSPAALSGKRAESVYRAIRGQMRSEYARSGDPVFTAYQRWTRFNEFPYRSPNHGERFVNHYANDKGIGYGRYETLDPLPAGAIIIKDSFVVTRGGGVMTGPLFMMEKMPPGFVSAAGTWRFLMVRPDGALFGMTGGRGAENVRFCAECHRKAGADHDYLYFMPKQVRLSGGRR